MLYPSCLVFSKIIFVLGSDKKKKKLLTMEHIVPKDLQLKRDKEKKKKKRGRIDDIELSGRGEGESAEQVSTEKPEKPKKKQKTRAAVHLRPEQTSIITKKNAGSPKKDLSVQSKKKILAAPNPYLDEFHKFQASAPKDMHKVFNPSLSENRRGQLLDLLDLGLIEKFAWAVPSMVSSRILVHIFFFYFLACCANYN